jgi:Zn-dependent protease with chaperone function
MLHKTSKALITFALIAVLVSPSYADRTQLKPGWNLFSAQQDVEMGRQVAREAEAELSIMKDRQVSAYMDALGRRLASKAPGERYPWQFKVVNDSTINAFALPGGFVYINRGIIEAASNEAELAGVVAHEISHVALRHGTNQVSKAYATQIPLALLGGIAGNGVGGILTQLGVGFAADSVLLKYSRDAERQADLLGAQILYDSGYDPRSMVNFFEKLQAQNKGRGVEFFSSHPNPENRIQNVQGEIQKLGGLPPNVRSGSSDFQRVKNIVASMAASPKARTAGDNRSGARGRTPSGPSARWTNFESRDVRFRHPENWRAYGDEGAVTLAPDGGVVNNALAWGMIASSFEPSRDRRGRSTLESATDQLVTELRRSNPSLRQAGNRERVRVAGRAGLAVDLTNESPVGGRETDRLVTVLGPDGFLHYFLGVAPRNDFSQYESAFEGVVNSVWFK